MKAIFLVLAALLLSTSVLLGLPKALNLAQANWKDKSGPTNLVKPRLVTDDGQIEGITQNFSFPESQGIEPPHISSSAALVEDLDNGFLLFVKDPHKKVPIASTTKIMTALVASSYFKPNQVLTVTTLPPYPGSTMGLKIGEQMTFRSLLYGLLLNSGNDAAYTIAANYPGSITNFVEAMNQKALSLNLFDTHFENPAGFDSPLHYSSASDLSEIAKQVTKDPQLARIVATKETSVSSVDKTLVHSLKNLNKLLDLPEIKGIKTGFTPQARENLVGLIDKDGHRLLTVVLGSDDRFGETKILMDWSYANFIWKP